MEFQNFKYNLIESLKKDNLKSTFELFFEISHLENELYSELILNNAQYQRIERAYRSNLIDWDTMSRNKNVIIDALLKIIFEVESQQFSKTDNIQEKYQSKSEVVKEIEFKSSTERIILNFKETCDKLDENDFEALKIIITKELKQLFETIDEELIIHPSVVLAGKLYQNKINQPHSGELHGELRGIKSVGIQLVNSIDNMLTILEKNIEYLDE